MLHVAKTNLLLLLAISCGVGYGVMELVVAPGMSESVAQHDHPTSGLVSLDPVYDFGRVDTGRPLTHTFWLKNLTDRPLRVLDTRHSCACTGTEVSQEPVAPGQTVPLMVTVNWKGRAGRQQASVWVHTDEPVHAIQTLVFTADAGSKPMIAPSFIRPSSSDGSINQIIQVFASEKSGFDISSVHVPVGVELKRLDSQGRVAAEESLSGPPGRFRITCGAGALARSLDDKPHSVIFHTNDPEFASMSVVLLNSSPE